MRIRIERHGPEALPEQGTVPIAFRVESVLRVAPVRDGLGGIVLTEVPVAEPWTKDYDALDGPPERWAKRWDLSNWGVLQAREVAAEGEAPGPLVGAAVLAHDTEGVNMLQGRRDLAVLWDLRVRPDCRRIGVGTRLFGAAADWARRRHCTQLKIETSNANVPACRFYAARGCTLGAIDRFAYYDDPRVAGETQLLWFLNL